MHANKILATFGLAAAIVIAAAGCGGHASGSVGAAASSALANPTVSADIAQAESELTANVNKDFSAAHPVDSMKTALRATFPQGDLSAIFTFAIKNLTPADYRKGHARDAWVQKVVIFALGNGASAAASPAAGASISVSVTATPDVTGPVPSVSVSVSPGSANIPGTSQSAVSTP